MSHTRTVMIACVTTEVAMVTDPVVFFSPDEVHLISYVRDPSDPRSRVYTDDRDAVLADLAERCPSVTVREHRSEPVYDYWRMLYTLNRLHRRLADTWGGLSILVNLSAGAAGFLRAAECFTDMVFEARGFTVPTVEYSVEPEEYFSRFYRDGRAVGMSLRVGEPRLQVKTGMSPPERDQILALRLFARLCDSGSPHDARTMVFRMKGEGLWSYTAEWRDPRRPLEEREETHFRSRYFRTWLNRGWIEHEGGGRGFTVTDAGRMVAEAYYPEPV